MKLLLAGSTLFLVCFVLRVRAEECPTAEEMLGAAHTCKTEEKFPGCMVKCFLTKFELLGSDGQLDRAKLDPYVTNCAKQAEEHGVNLEKLKTCITAKPVDTSKDRCNGYTFMLSCLAP